jgi:iron complex transport system permease protein
MTTLVKPRGLFIGLTLLCLLAIWLSLALGPVSLPLIDTLRAALRMLGVPLKPDGLEQAELILGQIRLPRTLLGLAVGGVLALSGVAMQGLFRNPLADPGLVGVSSGAALGAAIAIVGGSFFGGLPEWFGPYLLSVCAFLGGLGVTALVYRLGRRNGQTNVATMLLAGIALTALASSAVGLFTYLADDATLRTLTFWNLGSLNGASYARLWPLLIISAGVALWLPRRAKALNALLLGESEAGHLGIDVERLKRELVFCTALGVGAAVAAAGMIGFVGLVVPHLVRLLAGPDHKVLLPACLMLRAQNLHIHRGRKTVLSDVTLQLEPGEVLGVLGPNGAGKSTLLGALCGELAASAGGVSLDGQALSHWTGPQRAQRLAVLPQVSTLDFAFRVEEVVGMGRLPWQSGRVRDDEIIAAALAAADAGHLSGRSYLALSGGERQRVHLARVLAQLWPGQAGQTLLLDEPTSMLDPLHQHTTLQAVREFADRGAAVLVILHDLNLAARYCDRILLLEGGRPVALDTPQQVLQPDTLQAVFGLEVLVQPHPERGHPLIIAR